MAHYLTHFNTWDKEQRHKRLTLQEVPIPVPDDDWEEAHMAWLGFTDRLAIAMGCEECAEAIWEILEVCRATTGQ